MRTTTVLDLPEPVFNISITPPAGYEFGPTNMGANDAIDSDFNGVAALPIEGTTDSTYDFGLMGIGHDRQRRLAG